MDPLDHYPPKSDADRAALRKFIADSPLGYGPWRSLKGLYKRLEADPDADPALLGAFAARFDAATVETGDPPGANLGRSLQRHDLVSDRDRIAALVSVGGGQEVRVFQVDRDRPLAPTLQATVTGNRIGHVALAGDTLAVCGHANTIDFYDLRPSTPARLGATLHLPSTTQSVHRWGERFLALAVLQRFSEGRLGMLCVIETDADGAPRLGATLEIPYAFDVAPFPDGSGAAVLCERSRNGAARVQIVRLAGTGNLALGGSLPLGATAAAVSGSTLYVSAFDATCRLHRIDISDPDRPRRTQSVALASLPQALVAHGEQVFGGSRYGLVQVDFTAAAPKPVSLPDSVRGDLAGLAAAEGILYQSTRRERVGVWDIAHGGLARRAGAPPSRRTLEYLKRRVRRHLRRLAQDSTGRFVEAAAAALAALRVDRLDPSRHWCAYDLLFGGGKRFVHRSHGRGRLDETTPRRLVRRTCELRARDAWIARPDLAARLYGAHNLPAETATAALQVLLAADAPLPALSEKALARHLSSASPLLRAYAVRAALAQPIAAPALAAQVYVQAARDVRAGLEPPIVARLADPAWAAPFAAALLEAITQTRHDRLSRRQRGAALFLADHLRAQVDGAALLSLTPALLTSDDPRLTDLVLDAARGADLSDPTDWLQQLAQIADPAARARLLTSLEEAVRGKPLEEWVPYDLASDNDPIVRAAIWRLMASADMDPDELREIFDDLVFAAVDADDAEAATALGSPYALSLLERAGITTEDLLARIERKPFLAGLLTADAFRGLVQRLSGEAVLGLVAAVPESRWPDLRGGLLANLREGLGVDALIDAADRLLSRDETGVLASRLTDDPEMVEALAGVGLEVALEVREPALGGIVGRAVARERARLVEAPDLLLDAATHPLPEARGIGLELARARSPWSLAFALRLLECGIPDCVALATPYFDDAPDDDRFRRLLALCDSPAAAVRAHGLALVDRNRARLPMDRICAALAESADPRVQAFAATLLGDAPPSPTLDAFQRAVLKTPRRARRAKEAVKQRQDAAPTLDTPTLLTLARSPSSPREAQWALQHLVRRALAGETIEGLEL